MTSQFRHAGFSGLKAPNQHQYVVCIWYLVLAAFTKVIGEVVVDVGGKHAAILGV